MNAQYAEGYERPSRSHWLCSVRWLLIPVLLLSFPVARAQQLTATLSGIATDQTSARIPGAKVVVKNQASGDIRNTVADTSGFFSITALPPGTYTVTISSKGFASWEETDIVLSQGDSRTIANIHLAISSDTTAVTVVSGQDAEVPVDTAEVSSTLNNQVIDSAVLVGRNAAELIKMMPGVAFNGSTNPFSGNLTTSTNSGPAGSFSANGTQPYGSTDVYLDGANLIDPGNAGTQVANINQDMTDSIKYLSASYGAEYAKGPAVLQAFSKSGGQKFHGEGYVYARNSNIGFANDWWTKDTQVSNGNPNKVEDQSYYYFGGNVGGPIFFPHFNHNRNKLFFWAGYEYMKQNPFSSPAEMNVPTTRQLNGDFSTNGLPAGILTSNYVNSYALPCNTDDGWQGCTQQASPWGKQYTTWSDPNTPPNLKSYFDPNGVALTNVIPKPNQTPNQGNGYNNYLSPYGDPSAGYATLTGNRWEATGKVTYAINDNNKLWGSYAYQTENDAHPVAVWWNPAWTIPYPSLPGGKETANLYLVNFTHVFSATTTNEFVFTYAHFVNDISQTNPNAALRKTINFPTESLFGGAGNPQIPNATGGWEAGIAEINYQSFYGGIYGANSFGKTAKAPSIADTFTKILGTHSIKAGFYWDAQENIQSTGAATNGNFDVENWGSTSTYNMTLDRLMGRNQAYTEASSDPVTDELWHQWSLWGQDSWKVTRKLTLNYGLRADHMGQWYDKLGGTQVWDLSKYVNTPNPPANTGLVWHENDSSVPESGWKSRLFEWAPRVGVTYDLYGNGRSVLRAGFGTYYYQVSNNDAGNAMKGPLGSYSFSTGQATSAGQVNGFYGYNIAKGLVYTQNPITTANAQQTQIPIPTALNQVGVSGVIADKLGDDEVPYADTYSFGIAQALPAHTVMEISYVGSASREQLENGSNGHIFDGNPVPYGSFFTKDPHTGQYENVNPIGPSGATCPSGASCTGVSTNDWRALNNYGSVWIQGHGGYANYNSLQISGQKQSGNLTVFTNFTFGKVLGTRDGSSSNGNGNGSVINPFDFSSTYGPLGYDHTKIFNLSASYKLPELVHGHALLGEVVNGWQLSTYTTYQDGAPFQANNPVMNENFHQYICTSATDPHAGCAAAGAGGTVNQAITMPYPTGAPVLDSQGDNVGPTTYSVSTSTWWGSNQYENGFPQPVLVCDPRIGLKKGQYFNPNCFRAPLPPTATTVGETGQTVWPYIRTPHYFDSDLALFKAFRVTDSQRFEIRVSASNWLNHPNANFGQGGNNNDNTLNFNGIPTGSNLVFNSNTSTTGTPAGKYGFRWIQFAGKYYF